MWMTGTYDPQLDLVYVGTGNPTPVLNRDSPAPRSLRASEVDEAVLDIRADERHPQLVANVGSLLSLCE